VCAENGIVADIRRTATQAIKPGSTVVVVGDGAVGLLGVLSAKQMGAEPIIAMSRHEARQKLAREFGATDIVTERGEDGVARIKELTKGIGADSVLECVGTDESMKQAIRATRPGGFVSYVGVPHGVDLKQSSCFTRMFICMVAPLQCVVSCHI
jgi:threonine dehydrogenase-like Zn-dependent dehydrogenase